MPIAELLAPAYARERAGLIRMDRAAPALPAPGDPRRRVSAGPGLAAATRTPASEADAAAPAADGTTHIAAIDRDGGVMSELQTSRAEGALYAAAATIPELKSQITAKENQISTLLGRNPGPIPRGAPLFEQPVVPTVPAGLPSALLERRPDLRQAEQQLVAANAEIGVAKAEFFPKLSLTGFLGKASPELSAITSGAATIWSIAAGLTGPIFQGGKILANYRATVAVWEQSKWQYEQAVITAFQDVASNLAALEDLSGAEAEQARSVRALEKAVGHANDRFFYGLASYYEVLEAMQRLYPSQNSQVQIRLKRLVAYVQLYKALGGGWNVEDPQSMPPGQTQPGRSACAAAHC